MYYRPVPVDAETLMLQSLVDRLYMDFPYYGTRRVSWHLRRLGHDVGREWAHQLTPRNFGGLLEVEYEAAKAEAGRPGI